MTQEEAVRAEVEPGGTFSATPLLGLTLVAAAVTAAGLMALPRRDIPVG